MGVAAVLTLVLLAGPQPAAMRRMLARAQQRLAQQQWTQDQRQHIESALARLDHDFSRLLAQASHRV